MSAVFLECRYAFLHLRYTLDVYEVAGEIACLDHRISHEALSGSDRIGHSRLRSYLVVIAYGDMTGESYLSGYHAARTDFRRAGNAYLSGHDGVFTYLHVVGHLDKIIEFHSVTYACRAHRGAVDACVGTDFHIVGYLDIAYLGYFIVFMVDGSKTESVGSDYGAAMYDATLADMAVVIDFDTGLYHGVVAYHDIIADIRLRENLDTAAYLGSAAYIGERSDVYVVGELHAFGDI